jgi:hypothetical protein
MDEGDRARVAYAYEARDILKLEKDIAEMRYRQMVLVTRTYELSLVAAQSKAEHAEERLGQLTDMAVEDVQTSIGTINGDINGALRQACCTVSTYQTVQYSIPYAAYDYWYIGTGIGCARVFGLRRSKSSARRSVYQQSFMFGSSWCAVIHRNAITRIAPDNISWPLLLSIHKVKSIGNSLPP